MNAQKVWGLQKEVKTFKDKAALFWQPSLAKGHCPSTDNQASRDKSSLLAAVSRGEPGTWSQVFASLWNFFLLSTASSLSFVFSFPNLNHYFWSWSFPDGFYFLPVKCWKWPGSSACFPWRYWQSSTSLHVSATGGQNQVCELQEPPVEPQAGGQMKILVDNWQICFGVC